MPSHVSDYSCCLRDADQPNGNGSSLTNGSATKMEVDTESEAIEELLKRVPYKTNSIFFRNIPATAKYEDLENVSSNFTNKRIHFYYHPNI